MNNNNAHDGSRERLLGRITALLWNVVIAPAVTFFYFASSLCITILLSHFLERLHLPRSASAGVIEPVTNKIQRLQENTQKLSPAAPTKKVPEVRISETPSWPSYLARGVGSVGGAIIIAGVVPFLMFFMLVRKEHICDWLCTTFGVGYGEGLDYCWPCR